jgi:hypothetical protein
MTIKDLINHLKRYPQHTPISGPGWADRYHGDTYVEPLPHADVEMRAALLIHTSTVA